MWKSSSASGAPPSSGEGRHRHAIEQASRRWRGWSGCNWTRSSTDGGGERELGSADSPGACIAMVRTRCPGWDVARFPEVGSGPCSCRNVTAVTPAATPATRRRLGCVDDTSTSDARGHGYDPWYDEHPHECGAYDDAGFTAKEQCCSCGGGTFPASARLLVSDVRPPTNSAYSYDYDGGYLDCVVRDAVGHPTAAPTVTAAPTATPSTAPTVITYAPTHACPRGGLEIRAGGDNNICGECSSQNPLYPLFIRPCVNNNTMGTTNCGSGVPQTFVITTTGVPPV